jgi:hypothetical protein
MLEYISVISHFLQYLPNPRCGRGFQILRENHRGKGMLKATIGVIWDRNTPNG